jgi:Tol biopolymer transport system component
MLGAVLGVAPAASAPSNTPASNGWIAFASDRIPQPYSSYGLYRLDPIGAEVTPLGTLGGVSPVWSPDGGWIAFSDRRQRLIVAAADGTRARRLTDRPVIAEEPSWSPDGSRIVFQHAIARGARGRDLAIINVDGTGLRRITRGPNHDLQPAWSPDGSLIAFSTNRGPVRRFSEQDEIYVIRPNGRALRALTNNHFGDFSPAWSPDGRLIAFSSGRRPGGLPEIWAMRSNGTGERRVQPAAAPSGLPVWSDHSPSWSPDGNWLVYASTEGPYGTNVYIVRPDGQDKIDLTPGTHSYDFDPAWQPLCSHLGTPGHDALRGTPEDDRLCGSAGNDSIRGGTGRDGLYGGDGNDVIRARDGSFDVVGCGSGRDEAVADRIDLVGVDCERIRRG